MIGTAVFGTACLAMTSFFNYSPYMAKTSAPASPWADAPIPLVATPQHLTGKVRRKHRSIYLTKGSFWHVYFSRLISLRLAPRTWLLSTMP